MSKKNLIDRIYNSSAMVGMEGKPAQLIVRDGIDNRIGFDLYVKMNEDNTYTCGLGDLTITLDADDYIDVLKHLEFKQRGIVLHNYD
jgi:hypothetical protein